MKFETTLTHIPRPIKGIVVCCFILTFFMVGCQKSQSLTPGISSAVPFSPTPSPSPVKKPLTILFIGNSYTDLYFSIPQLFSELSKSGGHAVEIDVSAPGGWTLAQHSESQNTEDIIRSKNWDYVVLQENGRIASNQNTCIDEILPVVKLIDKKIPAEETKLIFFMQWACRDGTSACGTRDFDETQAELQFCYENLANEMQSLLAPVGVAWEKAVSQYPELDVWHGDGIHASNLGAYLGACVFYSLLYQESPVGIPYTENLSAYEARSLQAIAAETVLEDP